jgi:hypothetical protein
MAIYFCRDKNFPEVAGEYHILITYYDGKHELFSNVVSRIRFMNFFFLPPFFKGCRGSDRMVVGFKTTCATSVYHH